MIEPLLASALLALAVAQAPAPAPGASPADSLPAVSSPEPAASPVLRSPTDDFGPDLKAWLDATRLQDHESASKALVNLQALRAQRNIAGLDDVAGAIAGRAEVRASEGSEADAAEALDAAIAFDPDSSALKVQRANAGGGAGTAWGAVSTAWVNPLEKGRVVSVLLFALLVIAAFFTAGFAFSLLLRYAAIFSHDVSEGLPAPLKSLALSMAVLFAALPLAGFLGWGYLPFWWITLFFIFQSKAERTVSVILLVALALSGLALPVILHQASVTAAPTARPLYLAAAGSTSSESESLVRKRAAADPDDLEWALLSANLARRGGRFDEASAMLQARANADPRFAHNAAVIEANKGNYAAALPVFAQASEAPLTPRARATALYNLSLAQANTLAFDPSQASRKKADAIDGAALARYDQLFAFDRNGSILHPPVDIVPETAPLVAEAVPAIPWSVEDGFSRLTVIALAFLLFIPGVVKFKGARSFSKQCPKCGTTFCWLCQTRSTSQDVCSQCHHLFVVKRGIPPKARAAKNAEISRFTSTQALVRRVASLAAPGSAHLRAGDFVKGLPLLSVWAVCMGAGVSLYVFAPRLIADGPLRSTLITGFSVLALVTYVLAQVMAPRPPRVAVAPRRTRAEAQA